MLNKFGPAAFASLLLLAACGGGENTAKNDDDGEESPPVPVEVGSPSRGDIYAVYRGTAPIEAFAEAVVKAKVQGEVRAILVEEGDDVVAGQVLARLDGDRLRLGLSESEARLRKLQRDFDRNVELNKKGLISDGDFERIKYEMEALEASHNLAKLELDYTQIRSPIDGVISERFIKVGQTLNVEAPVFHVTSFEPLVAYLHVPERQYRNIEVGQRAAIAIDALSGPPIMANVTRVSPIVDPDTGTFKITIEIVDEERRIKPGMFGRIGVIYDRHENALQVPRSSIVEDLGESSVFVVEDGVAVRKVVETGYSDRGMVEILSGISDDERIVVVGQLGLKPDSKVTVINEKVDEQLNLADNPETTVSDNAPSD